MTKKILAATAAATLVLTLAHAPSAEAAVPCNAIDRWCEMESYTNLDPLRALEPELGCKSWAPYPTRFRYQNRGSVSAIVQPFPMSNGTGMRVRLENTHKTQRHLGYMWWYCSGTRSDFSMERREILQPNQSTTLPLVCPTGFTPGQSAWSAEDGEVTGQVTDIAGGVSGGFSNGGASAATVSLTLNCLRPA
ncbi:hypothetical protein [Herbidospora sp. RD11066]